MAVSGAVVQTAQLRRRRWLITCSRPGSAQRNQARRNQSFLRYQDRRLVALLFDFSTMDIPEQIRVQKTAIDFIHQDLKPADLVCIMWTSTGPL